MERWPSFITNCSLLIMSTWVTLSLVVLSSSLVRGEYGDKVRASNTSSSSSSENFGSSEEYYDDSLEERQTATPEKPLTTPDDGVVIEKAILAAEITPKASYNLIDYPIRYDESLGDSYTQAKFGDKKEFFGYSSSDALSQEDVDTVIPPSKHETVSNNDLKTTEDKANTESMQKSPQTHNGYQFPSWNFLGMYNIPSVTDQQLYSASYSNPTNIDNNSNKASDIKNNGLGLSEDGTYDPVANGDFLHLGYQISPQQPDASFSPLISPELSSHLEQERQYQIQSTKSYLKQVEAAQEYAAKVQALQEALYPSFQSSQVNYPVWPTIGPQEPYSTSAAPLTAQTPKPQSVPKPDASNYAQHNTYPGQALFSPKPQPTAVQVNSLAGGGWMYPGAAVAGPSSGYSPYTGPTASPVVLPSGFLADTEEVMQARIAHLQALMDAMRSSLAWKNRQLRRWS